MDLVERAIPIGGRSKTGVETVLKANTNTKIYLGFKPKYLCVTRYNRTDLTVIPSHILIYDEEISDYKYYMAFKGASGSDSNLLQRDLGISGSARLWSIDEDGFTVNPNNMDEYIKYVALA